MSIKSWSSGSSSVIFLALGPIFRMKNSLSEMVWFIELSWVNLKFIFWAKFSSYFNCESAAGLTIDSKLPRLVPVKELLASVSV